MKSTLKIQVQTIKHAVVKIRPSSLLEVTETVCSESCAKRLITCGKVHIINEGSVFPIYNDKEIVIYPGMIIQCGRKRVELKFDSVEINISAQRV